MPEVPQDSNFVKELQFVHVVVVVFRSESGKAETSVYVYHSKEDAQKRYERIAAMHEASGKRSPLIMTETFMAGVYENFEQSLFMEVGDHDKKVM